MTGSEYRSIRKGLGLTQIALAEALKISLRKVIMLEKMDAVPVTDANALRWLAHENA